MVGAARVTGVGVGERRGGGASATPEPLRRSESVKFAGRKQGTAAEFRRGGRHRAGPGGGEATSRRRARD